MMDSTFEGIDWSDYLVISLYFLLVLGVGLIASWKSKRDSVGGYFLASRSMHFVPVGASLFASNIGSGHFIGLAGTGAASGIAITSFELSAIFFILMLGWLFVPVYMASSVYTMPEYLRKRFGGQRIRIYLSVLALLLYVFTKISADLYAGALFITQATQFKGDLAIYIAILVLLAIACIFTVAGGLTAVIWTDFVQTVLMIAGALVLAVISFIEVGGYEQLIKKYFVSFAEHRVHRIPNDNTTNLCAGVPEDAMHLFRGHESDLPWTGVVFGLSISSIWYWCSDQVIVQRALAAKNMVHAKGGCVLAGYLKLLPLFIMVFPGMAARTLFPNEIACASPESCKEICNSEAGCTNLAFVKLVNELMPSGARGLMLAVMLAALMSSLSSIFNSSSTIFTMDIYTRLRPRASQRELIIAGRIFVFVLVVVSIIWIPIIQVSQGSQLFIYIQSITSYLAPPICAVYLLAIFWPRTNEPGAFWGLIGGLFIGLIRFGLEFGYSVPPCGSGEPGPPEWWQGIVGDIHYLNFGLLLWAITGLITIMVSIITEPISKDFLYRLTFWTRHSTKVRLEEEVVEYGAEEQTKRSISCGDSGQTTRTKMEIAQDAAAFLYEPKCWKRFVNVNALILMSITCFMWGFYA